MLTYRATVPANTTATLYLPAPSVESVREGATDARRANGVTFVKYEHGKAVFTLEPGRYTFTASR